jgi:hypothetical protein
MCSSKMSISNALSCMTMAKGMMKHNSGTGKCGQEVNLSRDQLSCPVMTDHHEAWKCADEDLGPVVTNRFKYLTYGNRCPDHGSG